MNTSARLKSIVLGIACATLAAPLALAQNQPPVHLPLGLKEGQTVRFGFQEVELLTNKAEPIRGGAATNQYQTEIQAAFRATEATTDGLTVEMIYERAYICVESPVMKEVPCFDTSESVEAALENLFAPAMLAIIKKPIILHLNKSGMITGVDAPKVEIPDVKFHGVAEQMLLAEWIIPRFQPIFSLTAPGPDAPASLWTAPGQMPLAHGVAQQLRVETMNVVDSVQGNRVRLKLGSKAEILPYEGADPLNPRDLKFKGAGEAEWNTADGMLWSRSIRHEWSFNAQPQPNLPTFVDTSVHTILHRLK